MVFSNLVVFENDARLEENHANFDLGRFVRVVGKILGVKYLLGEVQKLVRITHQNIISLWLSCETLRAV